MNIEKFYGVMAVISLSTDINIDWDLLYDKGKGMDIDNEDIPLPTPANKHKNILEIKEIRRAIENFMKKCNGVKVRESGGVFFVPRDFLCNWLHYCKFLTEFKGIEIINFDVYETATNKNIIAKAFLEDIRRRLKEEVKKLSKRIAEGNIKEISASLIVDLGTRKISIRAIDFMYGRLEYMTGKIDIYETILNMDMNYVRKEVEGIVKALLNYRNQELEW